MKVELQGITKRFPGVVANADVDLSVDDGEVLALLGENGAGKSTLMNVLFGLYRPDEGQILLDGVPVRFSSPADAIRAGIGMVHQHFMLVPVFTVTENVILGTEPTGVAGTIDRDEARQRVLDLSAAFGLEVDPDAVIEELPVGIQQRVEILKALYRQANCLILDEPTSVLTPNEIVELMEIITSLKEGGRSIIFISHKLKEVLAVADDIAVLRRGRVVGHIEPDRADEQTLASMMVGRDVRLVVDKTPAQALDPVLEIDDLVVVDARRQRVVDGVSFTVRAGEIVAVAGVQGNGQSELIEAIAGMRPVGSGTVRLDGRDVTGWLPDRLFAAGIAHVPEDRQRDGLVSGFPVADNMVLNQCRERPYARGIVVDWGAVNTHAEQLVRDFDVRAASIQTPAGTLSGGNQQKVIVAREFSHVERLLLLSQPTRGLDVGSIQYIHARAVAKRDEGVAVVLNSSELDEVMALADRIVVMYRGRIIGELERADATRDAVGLLMAGSVAEAERALEEGTGDDAVVVT
ncbi:MAG: ABC transporter ATP-binding protein [Acidimicrobiales bacterium]